MLAVVLPWGGVATLHSIPYADDVFTSDLTNHALPERAAVGEALRHGQLPLWMPTMYGGFPVLAESQAGALYPPNLLAFGLLPPAPAFSLTLLLSLLVAAFGARAWTRQLGGSEAGAWLAGVAFAWSGFVVSHVKHPGMIAVAAWMPVGLLLWERAARRMAEHGVRAALRPLALLAVVFALQILAGHVQIAYYSGLVYVLVIGGRAMSRPPARPLRAAPTVRAALAGWAALAAGVALAAPQLLPTRELAGLSGRGARVSFEYATTYAYDPANLLTFVLPRAHGTAAAATYTGPGVFAADYGYVGIVTLLLAVLAVGARLRRRGPERFLALGAIVALAVAVGPATPLYRVVFESVPGMAAFRFPNRLLCVVDLCLAVLGGLGLSVLTDNLARRLGEQPARAVVLLVALLSLGDLLVHQREHNAVLRADRWLEPPATAARIREDPGRFRVLSVGDRESHRAAFTAARGWSGDLSPYLAQRAMLQPAGCTLWGISTPNGYAQLVPAWLFDVWGDQNSPGGLIWTTATLDGGTFVPTPAFVRILSLHAVRYVVSAWPVAGRELEPLGSTADGAHLLRNPSAMPRAFVVGATRTASSAADAHRILLGEDFDPRAEAVVLDGSSGAPGEPGIAGDAVFMRDTPDVVELRVRATRDAHLVLADTWYPGWEADVDGLATPVLRADFSQRAVAVPAGEHVVRFRYRPASFRTGVMVAAGAALLLALAWMAARGSPGALRS